MKKFIPLTLIALFVVALSSCGGKCGTCSDQSLVSLYTGEFCKGNIVEDALYQSAKAECETAGGTFE